jgi:hypothetical protein
VEVQGNPLFLLSIIMQGCKDSPGANTLAYLSAARSEMFCSMDTLFRRNSLAYDNVPSGQVIDHQITADILPLHFLAP